MSTTTTTTPSDDTALKQVEALEACLDEIRESILSREKTRAAHAQSEYKYPGFKTLRFLGEIKYRRFTYLETAAKTADERSSESSTDSKAAATARTRFEQQYSLYVLKAFAVLIQQQELYDAQRLLLTSLDGLSSHGIRKLSDTESTDKASLSDLVELTESKLVWQGEAVPVIDKLRSFQNTRRIVQQLATAWGNAPAPEAFHTTYPNQLREIAAGILDSLSDEVYQFGLTKQGRDEGEDPRQQLVLDILRDSELMNSTNASPRLANSALRLATALTTGTAARAVARDHRAYKFAATIYGALPLADTPEWSSYMKDVRRGLRDFVEQVTSDIAELRTPNHAPTNLRDADNTEARREKAEYLKEELLPALSEAKTRFAEKSTTRDAADVGEPGTQNQRSRTRRGGRGTRERRPSDTEGPETTDSTPKVELAVVPEAVPDPPTTDVTAPGAPDATPTPAPQAL